MLEGDKVIAIGKQECQDLLHDQLIGDPEAIGRPTRLAAPAWTGGGVSGQRNRNTLDNAIVRVLACVHVPDPPGTRS